MSLRVFWGLAILSLLQLHCSVSKKSGKLADVITEAEVYRIEAALSHDSMEGRKSFTKGIDKAAAFIASEMKAAGLRTFNSLPNYLQEFTINEAVMKSAAIDLGDSVDANMGHAACLSNDSVIHIDQGSGYAMIRISTEDEYTSFITTTPGAKQDTWVLLDKQLESKFRQLKRARYYTMPAYNVVYTLVPDVNANHYSVHITQAVKSRTTSNVVGMLPGKKLPDQYVIFAAHYDHLGYGRPDEKGDSLYNGANDDASGTTAVLTLAKYFSQQKNNERSILFVAFSSEELGLIGSSYFSSNIDANKVVAMFNLEMIGTESKWGKNSAYITGYDKSDFGKILQQNVDSTQFKFHPDPYTAQQLFYRSDNAKLALTGVPAHSISTSKMDNEAHYHKASDEIATLDMHNMTSVIRAIAQSARTIISGVDTPSRIDPKNVGSRSK